MNNPVNLTDDMGYAWWHWFFGALIIIASVGLAFFTAGATSALGIAVHGIAKSAAISSLISSVSGAVASGIEITNEGISFNWENAAEGFMFGAMSGAVLGAVSNGLTTFANSATGLIANIMNHNLAQGVIMSLVSAGVLSIESFLRGENIELSDLLISVIFGYSAGYHNLSRIAYSANTSIREYISEIFQSSLQRLFSF